MLATINAYSRKLGHKCDISEKGQKNVKNVKKGQNI